MRFPSLQHFVSISYPTRTDAFLGDVTLAQRGFNAGTTSQTLTQHCHGVGMMIFTSPGCYCCGQSISEPPRNWQHKQSSVKPGQQLGRKRKFSDQTRSLEYPLNNPTSGRKMSPARIIPRRMWYCHCLIILYFKIYFKPWNLLNFYCEANLKTLLM